MIVEFYKTIDGYKPAGAFINSIEDKKLRAVQGSDIARCLYFFVIGNKAVVTNGFLKKTQNTPRDIIEKAKEYRGDYLRRLSDE
ncbi:type II toxin-antitoxin system RelE/ParE family toxin [Butyrivibrio sp. VCB2001]|uniref:type II toxin-antitoxin system RelE/ParE family toxin n=1 Tax=Butyrivibrio sp. VCB2001 TaxID=1280667 RepID=UPI000429384C|nr:type II toxin-antitoxin system RelE/ParE family toxin [Butyrivibrio sp. VCB2001]